MAVSRVLEGVAVAMITPFDNEDQVDIVALKELTRFLVKKGVDCIYLLGSTGEMFRLSTQERKMIAKTVVNEVSGQLPVVVQVAAMAYDTTVELAKHAFSVGASGISAVTPTYFAANPRELEEYYVGIAQAVPDAFPVYLYNIPQCAANDLSVNTVERIVKRCSNVVGIKFTSPDIQRTLDYLQIDPGLSVLNASDDLFVFSLLLGCTGIVSGTAGVYPEPFVALYEAFKQNDLTRAKELQVVVTRLSRTLTGGRNIAYFKEALAIRGFRAGSMRRPQLNLSEEEIDNMKVALQAVEQKLDDLGIEYFI